MGEGKGLDWFMSSAQQTALPDELNRLLKDASEKAEEYGRIVGRVSRFFPVVVGGENRVVVEVDPETYYGEMDSSIHRVGDYLLIVDLKGKLILGRVASIKRGDLLSMIGSNMPADITPLSHDPSSLATTTLIEVEPLMESDASLEEKPVPASTSIEPQSPVVDPKPVYIARLLSLPEEGALIGALATPSELVKQGAIGVRLPFKVFLQHVLVIGTTGSGKTTFLKNLAAEIYSSNTGESPILVFADMNQDFIQLAFDPLPLQEVDDKAELVRERLFSNVGPVNGVIVVLPITEYVLADSMIGDGRDWCDYAVKAVKKHLVETVEPILTGMGWDYRLKEPRRTASLYGSCRIEVEVMGRRLIYIPYAINTVNTPTSSITRLMPDMTLLSLDLFKRTRERFKRLYEHYPPLLAIAAAIHSYLESLQRRQGRTDHEEEIEDFLIERLRGLAGGGEDLSKLVKKDVKGLDRSLVDSAGHYIELLARSRPNWRTLEALYRRINSILDAGILDIVYPEEDNTGYSLSIAPEPDWEEIIEISKQNGFPIVLDLGVLNTWGAGGIEAARLLAYRMLEKLKDWKHELWARRSSDPLAKRKVIVVIDEAHQFFPQQKGAGDEQEAARQIASMISQIARLGRARGIGLIFATHSPRDLHDIILQLSNTKIILRTEKNQLDAIDIPGDIKKYIPHLPDRFMVVSSYIYKDYLVVATTTPLTMHYDLSA